MGSWGRLVVALTNFGRARRAKYGIELSQFKSQPKLHFTSVRVHPRHHQSPSEGNAPRRRVGAQAAQASQAQEAIGLSARASMVAIGIV